MTFATIAFAAAAAALAYWFLLRPILARMPQLAPFYARLDAIEAPWRAKIGLAFDGLRTVLLARLTWLSMGLLFLHDTLLPFFSAVDWTPFVVEPYRQFLPLAMAVLGAAFEWLRHISNKPVGEPAAIKVE